MRISDWSSDVCSSQLGKQQRQGKSRAGDRDIERHVAGETREGERLETGVGKQAKDRDCEAYAQPFPRIHWSLPTLASPACSRSRPFGARPDTHAKTLQAHIQRTPGDRTQSN